MIMVKLYHFYPRWTSGLQITLKFLCSNPVNYHLILQDVHMADSLNFEIDIMGWNLVIYNCQFTCFLHEHLKS